MEWDGICMVEEMARLQAISRGETYVCGDFLMLRGEIHGNDSQGEPEDGGRDHETEAETGAAAGVGAQVGQWGRGMGWGSSWRTARGWGKRRMLAMAPGRAEMERAQPSKRGGCCC